MDSNQWKAVATEVQQRALKDCGGDVTKLDPFKKISDLNSPQVDPKELLIFILAYLEITPEQSQFLYESEGVMHDLDDYLRQAKSMMNEMRSQFIETAEDLETHYESMGSILTPTQVAKFLLWIDKNKACVHMLDELWKRTFPINTNDDGNHNNDTTIGHHKDVGKKSSCTSGFEAG